MVFKDVSMCNKILEKKNFYKEKRYLLRVIGFKVIQSAKIKSRLKRIALVNSLKIKGGKKNRLLNNGYTGPTKSID